MTVLVMQSDTVHTLADRLVNFYGKLDRHRTERREYVGSIAFRLNYFPAKKATLCVSGPGTLTRAGFPAAHGGFVGANDFVSFASHADLAVVDPDDLLAEAAHQVHLVTNKHHCAARPCHIPHFPQALLL